MASTVPGACRSFWDLSISSWMPKPLRPLYRSRFKLSPLLRRNSALQGLAPALSSRPIQFCLPRVCDRLRLTSCHTRQRRAIRHGLARRTTIFEFLAVLFLDDGYLLLCQRVIRVCDNFKDVRRASSHTGTAARALFSVNRNKVLAGAVLVAVVRQHRVRSRSLSPKPFL